MADLILCVCVFFFFLHVFGGRQHKKQCNDVVWSLTSYTLEKIDRERRISGNFNNQDWTLKSITQLPRKTRRRGGEGIPFWLSLLVFALTAWTGAGSRLQDKKPQGPLFYCLGVTRWAVAALYWSAGVMDSPEQRLTSWCVVYLFWMIMVSFIVEKSGCCCFVIICMFKVGLVLG